VFADLERLGHLADALALAEQPVRLSELADDCSGVCFLPFTWFLLALDGLGKPHITWTSSRGSGQILAAYCERRLSLPWQVRSHTARLMPGNVRNPGHLSALPFQPPCQGDGLS
jgi:hypothetical protein